mmetsp:Transcript_1682/g.2347  ORF Transcript_1682/g.2347 Transcript_1682/m.2347 type:complete len:174 (+) Transcript_1682:34-555(+)
MELKKNHHGAADVARQYLTKEMLTEVLETFRMAADVNGIMPHQKLPLALQALGMTVDDLSEGHASESFQYAEIDEDRFIELVVECMQKPNWAAEEMNESFCLFDVDGNGYVDPKEIRRTFTRLGENLADSEAEDQLREFDIDGDCQMVVAEYYKMIAKTRGADFIFDDSLYGT